MKSTEFYNHNITKLMTKDIREFVRYCIVGFLATVIDFTVLILLVEKFKLGVIVSATISFLSAATIVFFLHKYWVFNNHIGCIQLQYLKYLIIVTIGLLFNTAGMFYFYRILGLWYLVAKVFTTSIVVFWNYLGNKYWSFRQRKTVKGQVEEIIAILETLNERR